MARLRAAFAVLVVLLASPAGSQPRKTIALTFDDLPKAHGFDDIDGLRKTTDSILRVLKAHHAPAVAFVNEDKLYVGYHLIPERVDELRKWVDAGVVLGNHTYSHIDINTVSLQQYENNVIKGEKTYTRLMRGHSTEKWFRHPFTHTGPTAEIKNALNKFLATRGYRVAPFTIENSDYIFSAAYDKAQQAGDEAQAARIRDEYLTYSSTMVDWFESLSKDDFGRDMIREAIDETDMHQAVAAGMARLAELAHEWDSIRKRGKLTPDKRARIVAKFRAEQREFEEQARAFRFARTFERHALLVVRRASGRRAKFLAAQPF